MVIRPAITDDEQSISEMFYKLYPNFKAKKDPVSLNGISTKCITFVSEEDGNINGFIFGSMITYGPCKYGYIEELYVEEHSRRKGIGKQLVKKLLNEYQNLGVWAIFLMTDANDAGVQSFYRSIGFKESKGHWLYMENI